MTTDLPPPAVTTAAAQQLWEHADHTPWPKGLRVCWRDDFPPHIADALGCCSHQGKFIVLNWPCLLKRRHDDPDEPVFTFVHEFTHLRHPRLRHGREFQRIMTIVSGCMIGDTRMEHLISLRRLEARSHKLLARLRQLQRKIQPPEATLQ